MSKSTRWMLKLLIAVLTLAAGVFLWHLIAPPKLHWITSDQFENLGYITGLYALGVVVVLAYRAQRGK